LRRRVRPSYNDLPIPDYHGGRAGGRAGRDCVFAPRTAHTRGVSLSLAAYRRADYLPTYRIPTLAGTPRGETSAAEGSGGERTAAKRNEAERSELKRMTHVLPRPDPTRTDPVAELVETGPAPTYRFLSVNTPRVPTPKALAACRCSRPYRNTVFCTRCSRHWQLPRDMYGTGGVGGPRVCTTRWTDGRAHSCHSSFLVTGAPKHTHARHVRYDTGTGQKGEGSGRGAGKAAVAVSVRG
jgi:hypothetical protein